MYDLRIMQNVKGSCIEVVVSQPPIIDELLRRYPRHLARHVAVSPFGIGMPCRSSARRPPSATMGDNNMSVGRMMYNLVCILLVSYMYWASIWSLVIAWLLSDHVTGVADTLGV